MSKAKEEYSPFLFNARAVQYLDAADILVRDNFDIRTGSFSLQIDSAVYFLIGHSLELFFKSFDLHINGSFSEGHDVYKPFLSFIEYLKKDEKTKKISKSFHQRKEIIKLLNERYCSSTEFGKFDLRYPKKVGIRLNPHPDDLISLTKQIKQQVYFVLAARKADSN